ncbi:hypothetical protein [Xanthobacter autotrophicus]|uniref:hypothetical protein n=1 Tax=Xanthobacter autotrophicus TaxID=280 RepID=UPI00372BC202
MTGRRALAGGCVVVAMFVLAPVSTARAQLGIMNQVLDHAIQMQRHQQYRDQEDRAAARAQQNRAAAAERERKAEQGRQAAEKKAEDKRQAAEAAARQREAALARVSPPAEQLITEVSDFLKANPSHPNMLKYVEALSGLGRVVRDGDPAAIEKQTLSLSQLVQKDSAFSDFAAQRAEVRRVENARNLVDAIELADRQKRFLLAEIAQNPTAPTTERFLDLVKGLDEQATRPNLDQLKPLSAQVDLAIRQAGLRNVFLAAPPVAAAQGSLPVGSGGTATGISTNGKDGAALANALTEKNRFLLEGSVDDVIFAYNASSTAPHVLKNLKGDIVFEKKTASVCLFQKSVDVPDVTLARRALSPMALEAILIEPTPCVADRLQAYDVIMIRRAALFREDQVYVFALLKQVEIGAYAPLMTLSGTDMAAQSGDAGRRLEAIEQQSREGFGLLVVNNISGTVCVVVEEQREAHQKVLRDWQPQVAAEISAPPKLNFVSLDTAFAGVKRAQCAAIYADAAGLKGLAAALKRDGTPFQVSALWVDPGVLADASQRLTAEQAAADRQAYELRRALAENASVAALREADEAKTKAGMQAALRAKHGRQAQAATTLIANDVKLGIDGKLDSPGLQFVPFFDWLAERRKDRWEVFSINTEIFEYGTANWKGRSLEAGLVRLDIRLRNQVLGEYRSFCFVFSRLADSEFQMVREPRVFGCDEVASLSRWKTALQFASLWTVE